MRYDYDTVLGEVSGLSKGENEKLETSRSSFLALSILIVLNENVETKYI